MAEAERPAARPVDERQVAHSIGVTCEPEVTEVDLDASRDAVLLMASDGVWDVLTPQDVGEVPCRSSPPASTPSPRTRRSIGSPATDERAPDKESKASSVYSLRYPFLVGVPLFDPCPLLQSRGPRSACPTDSFSHPLREIEPGS